MTTISTFEMGLRRACAVGGARANYAALEARVADLLAMLPAEAGWEARFRVECILRDVREAQQSMRVALGEEDGGR